MPETSVLLWGMLFGSIGLGFFTYGKRQKAVVPLLTGIALFVAPYIFTSTLALVSVCLGLCLLPFFVRL